MAHAGRRSLLNPSAHVALEVLSLPSRCPAALDVGLLPGVSVQPIRVLLSGLPDILGAIVLDAVGRNWLTVPLANLGGFATLVAVAALASAVKAQPWRQREGRVRHGRPHEEAGVGTSAITPQLTPGE